MSRAADQIRYRLASFRSWYELHSVYINGTIALTSLVGFVLAEFAPKILDQLGLAVVYIVYSDATHTFLLAAILLLLVTPSPESQHRADGGEAVGERIAWAALFGLILGTIASSYGNEWVVPSILGGMAVWLFITDQN